MGCGCKKAKEQTVITSVEQTQTPDELHTLEMNEHGKTLTENYKLQEESIKDKTE